MNPRRVTASVRGGPGSLSSYGKRMVAQTMYDKGKNFLAAAILLRQRGGYEYVVLHLICQGVEIALKGLLLLRDYDRYVGQLKEPIGHNLVRLAATAVGEFGVRAFSPGLAKELEALNSLYSGHSLRYGTFLDVFVDPQTVGSDLVVRKIVAAMRLADRHIAAEAAVNASAAKDS